MGERRLAAVTLILGAGAATALLVLGERAPFDPEVAAIERSELSPEAPLEPAEVPAPRLEGRAPARVPPESEPTPDAPADAAADTIRVLVPEGARVELERARADSSGPPFRTWAGPLAWAFDAPKPPVRPTRPDWSLGDPGRRDRVARTTLLGGASLERALPSLGVVEVDHDDAGATIEEEIEEPLVTAAHGAVVSDAGPVGGAEVILYSTFYQRHARYDRHVREVGRTTTDGAGLFDLRPISLDTVHFGSDGDLLLTIRRDGFGGLVARHVQSIEPETVNDLGVFTLTDELATLYGQVRDRSGEPVEGAAVRVSGTMNPVRYDKTERMVILKDCPTAITDAEGRYRLTGFAPGTQHASIHVNIDCVLHQDLRFEPGGETAWSPRVLAGGSVRGRVVDPEGEGLAAAVVSGGGNWTPTEADGTFWLDNIEDGPFTLHVAHHRWRSLYVEGIEAGEDELELRLEERLPEITLFVRDAETGEGIGLIAIDWTWPNGRPHLFVPESRYWHADDGRYEVVVPEGAAGAKVSVRAADPRILEAEELEDGRVVEIFLGASDDE